MCAVRPMKESRFLHQGLILALYLLIIDFEVNIQSVEQFSIESSEQILSHFDVHISLASVIVSFLAYLYPC